MAAVHRGAAPGATSTGSSRLIEDQRRFGDVVHDLLDSLDMGDERSRDSDDEDDEDDEPRATSEENQGEDGESAGIRRRAGA